MIANHELVGGEAVIREVKVPDEELSENVGSNLELIFKYGQNDFQNVPGRCSVSVGDVIEYGHELIVVCGIGFKKLSLQQYRDFIAIPRRERYFSVPVRGDYV
jgi:hypothetical protein